MPLLKINAEGKRAVLHDRGDLNAELTRALDQIPADAPVVILIHGFRFSPALAATDPHRHILSLTPEAGLHGAISWPRHLGFGRGAADEGLCIAFGWEARGSIWRAWRSAERSGSALADLIARIRTRRAGRVDILCHSLGARVALTALGLAPGFSFGRVVLLAAAEYRSTALKGLGSPGGRGAEVINVTTRENDIFDAMVEWLVRAPERGDRALGAGLAEAGANWLDLQVDCAATRAALDEAGYRIAPPARRICHWSAYLRPGLFALYRDLIRDRQALPLAKLRQVLAGHATPRWSGLLRPPHLRLPPLPGSRSLTDGSTL